MMDTLCPQGHPSLTTDYCDQCGTPMAFTPLLSGADVEISSVTQLRTSQGAPERCPRCATPRVPGDRYCEVDGHDFERPDEEGVEGVEEAAGWWATVEADRSYFARVAADDLRFPDHPIVLTHELRAESVSVGRQSPSLGIAPDIDLGGAYEDPGVSRRHLRFDRLADGTYAAVDCGSANGTTINDDPRRIPPETPVPLRDGDRVHLGAWTTITIVSRRSGGGSARSISTFPAGQAQASSH